MPAPSPNDTPDGDRPTLEGLGLRGRARGLEAKVAIDAAGDEDAVEGRAVELEVFSAAFMRNAFFFTSFLAAGMPRL